MSSDTSPDIAYVGGDGASAGTSADAVTDGVDPPVNAIRAMTAVAAGCDASSSVIVSRRVSRVPLGGQTLPAADVGLSTCRDATAAEPAMSVRSAAVIVVATPPVSRSVAGTW